MSAPLAARVLDELGHSIVTGKIVLGQVLRIEDLARTYAVSRTVVREALRVLDSMNLIIVRRRVGIIVRPAEEWDVFAPLIVRWRLEGSARDQQLTSLTALRAGVEPLAAAALARATDEGAVATLLEAAEQMERCALRGDLDAYLEHDIAFHSTILARCGNEMFAALQAPVAEVLRARHVLNLMPDHPRDIAVQLHRLVALGIRDGDARTAAAAMGQIVAEVSEIVGASRYDGPGPARHPVS